MAVGSRVCSRWVVASVLVGLASVCAAGGARAETLAWARQSAAGAVGNDVAIGPDGSPYVAGQYWAAPAVLLRKFSPTAGDAVWSRRYGGPSSWDDAAFGVAVSPNGSVYVTGYLFAADYRWTLLLRKYSASGALQWSRTWRPASTYSTAGIDVAVGPDGEVYVAGSQTRETSNPGLFTTDLVLHKYTAGGTLVWTRVYNAPADCTDSAAAVAVAADGAVYVAGYTEVALRGYNVLVQKYTPRGALAWTRTYDGPATGPDLGLGIAVGAAGVYVGGTHQVTAGNDNVLLRKYTFGGSVAWTRSFDGGGADAGGGVAVGPDGSVFVAGLTTVTGEGQNVLVRKYSPAGDLLWRATHNTAGDNDDRGLGIAVGADGAVYVTGATRAAFSEDGPDYLLLLKYQ